VSDEMFTTAGRRMSKNLQQALDAFGGGERPRRLRHAARRHAASRMRAAHACARCALRATVTKFDGLARKGAAIAGVAPRPVKGGPRQVELAFGVSAPHRRPVIRGPEAGVLVACPLHDRNTP